MKKIVAAFALCLCGGVFDVPAYSEGVTGTSTIVDGGYFHDNQNRGQQLVRTLDGKLWAFFVGDHEGVGRVSYAISSDDGATWGEKHMLYNGDQSYCVDGSARTLSKSYSSGYNPSAAVDSQGVIHVAYTAQLDGRNFHIQLKDNCWSEPEPITDQGGMSPAIAVDGNDNLHVVSVLNYGYADYKKPAVGGSWEKFASFGNDVRTVTGVYAMGMDQKNQVHVAWMKYSDDFDGGQNIFHTVIGTDASVNTEFIEGNYCCEDPPDEPEYERPPYPIDMYHLAGLDIGMSVYSDTDITINYFRQNPNEKFVKFQYDEFSREQEYHNRGVGVWQAIWNGQTWEKSAKSPNLNIYTYDAGANSSIDSYFMGGAHAIWTANDGNYDPHFPEREYATWKATYVDGSIIEDSSLPYDGYDGSNYTQISPRYARWNNNGGPAGFLFTRMTTQQLEYFPLGGSMHIGKGNGPVVSNSAPVVNVGPDRTLTLPESLTIDASATDDNLPTPPATMTYLWSETSGPAPVVFSHPTDVDTTVTFTVPGVYVLRLSANDSDLTGYDELTVTVIANNTGGGDPGCSLPAALTTVDGIVSNWNPNYSGYDHITGRRTGRTSNGRLWTVYKKADPVTGVVRAHIAESLDNGATWIYQEPIIKDGKLHCPDGTTTTLDPLKYPQTIHGPVSLAIGADDSINIAFTEYDSNYNYYLWTMTLSGDCGCWTKPARVLLAYNTDDDPVIAFDSKGEMHLSWVGVDSYGYPKVVYKHKTTYRMISDPNIYSTPQNLSMDVDATQTAHFVWADGYYSGSELIYARLGTGNTLVRNTIATPEINGGESQTHPSMALWSNSQIYVAYLDKDERTKRLNMPAVWVASGDGNTWTKKRVSTKLYGDLNPDNSYAITASYPFPPTIYLDAEGDPHVVWRMVNVIDDNPWKTERSMHANSRSEGVWGTEATLTGTTISGGTNYSWDTYMSRYARWYNNGGTSGLLYPKQSNPDGYPVKVDYRYKSLGVQMHVGPGDNPSNPNINHAPTVNAGPDQEIHIPTELFIDATASDDGLPNPPATLTYVWSKISGPGDVTFNPPDVADTNVQFSEPGVYVLRLSVSDGALSNFDDITVTVYPRILEAPVANGCGDRYIILGVGETSKDVPLTSCSTDSDGTITTYSWTEFVTGATTIKPIYSGPNATTSSTFTIGTHEIDHTVTDDQNLTGTDGFLITVMMSNTLLPVADAGHDLVYHVTSPDQLVAVQLNGSMSHHSDPAKQITRFAWYSEPNHVILNQTSQETYDLNLGVGVFHYRLEVKDDAGFIDADEITVTVSETPVNQSPLANAGPDQSIQLEQGESGREVILDGSASTDSDGLLTQHAWNDEITGENLGNGAVHPVVMTAGVHRVRLTVTDDAGATDTATVVINLVPAPNDPPVVNAGLDASVTLPNVLVLNGSATDDGRPQPASLTHEWTQVSGPGGANFSTPDQLSTSVSFNAPGEYVLRLTASDKALYASDDINVTVTALNVAPIVNAGPDRAVQLPNTLLIKANATDDGLPTTALTYSWSKVSGPGSVVFGTGNTADRTATFSLPGAYILRLSVSDSANLSAYDDINVNVVPSQTTAISLVSPVHLSHVRGTVTVEADAFDSDGIARIEFYVNDSLVHTDNSAPYDYTWNTKEFVDGVKDIYAIAYDTKGNQNSDARSVTVDNTAPTISLTEPLNGTQIKVNQWLKTNADDNIGLAKVDFYVRGTLIHTDSGTDAEGDDDWDYIFITGTFSDGPAEIHAVATDLSGNETTSASINVNIRNNYTDTTKPNISFIAPTPAANTTVSGSVSIRVNASDSGSGIQFVCIYANGGLYSCASAPPYEAVWDTTRSEDIRTNILAIATDWAGNTQEVSRIYNVSNPDYPKCSITSPVNAAVVSGITDINVLATRNGQPELITRVEFSHPKNFVDPFPAPIYIDDTPPFSYPMDTTQFKNGTRYIMARAYDSLGRSEYDWVYVDINNPDRIVPNVSFSQPVNNATLRGHEHVIVQATDNQNIIEVKLKVDNVVKAIVNEAPYEFILDTLIIKQGFHTLQAEARDSSGNIGTASIAVNVDNVGANPNVSIISPNDGSIVTQPATIDVAAYDPQGINRVEVTANGQLLGSKLTAPYSFIWNITPADNGPATIRAIAYDTIGNQSENSINITVKINAPPNVSAGNDIAVSLPDMVNLDGSVSDDNLPLPPTLTQTWEKVSGPGTVLFGDATAIDTTASFTAPGIYTLRLSADDGKEISHDEVIITVYPPNKAPVADGGINFTVTLPESASLNGNATDDGYPVASVLSFTWTKKSGPGNVLFANNLSAKTSANFTSAGIYVLTLTVSDGDLSSSDDVTVTVLPRNQSPVVSAGDDQNATTTAVVSGTTNDDGLPNPPGAVSVSWSKVSGPGTVQFENANQLTTNVSFSAAGLYVLRLTASDSLLTAYDDVSITVIHNNAPTVNAGINQSVYLPNEGYLDATVSDDGLPNPPAVLTYSWTKTSGPGPVVFSAPTSADTRVAFTDAGIYVLTLTASDSQLSTSDDVTVTVIAQNKAPIVNVGADQTVTLPSTVHIDANVTDDNLPSPTLVFTWTKQSGPGDVTFASNNTVDTDATFSLDGSYVLRLTANDGLLSAYDELTVTVNPNGPNQPPIAGACGDLFIPTRDFSTPQLAELHSCSSDPDGVIIRYVWTEYSKNAFYFTGPQNTVTTNLLSPRSYAVNHYVTDNRMAVSTSTLLVTVLPPDTHLPVANAGPDRVLKITSPGQKASVTLDGTKSRHPDSNRRLIDYQWFSEPEHVKLNLLPRDKMSVSAGEGVHRYRLEVYDDQYFIDSDEVVITVAQGTANVAPVAKAGTDQLATTSGGAATADVTLDGSASLDTDGTITSYSWARETDRAEMGTNAVQTVSLERGIHRMVLTVTDNNGDTDKSTVVITVKGPTGESSAGPLSVSLGADKVVALISYDNGGLNAQTQLTATVNGSADEYLWFKDGCSGGVCGEVSIDHPTALTTSVRFSNSGVYRMAFRASNDSNQAVGYVTVTVDPSNIGGGFGPPQPENSPIESVNVVDNPMFNPLQGTSSVVKYTMQAPDTVSIIVYDSLGQQVKTLFNGYRDANTYTVEWNGRDDSGHIVTSGLYLIVTQAGSNTVKTKVIVAK